MMVAFGRLLYSYIYVCVKWNILGMELVLCCMYLVCQSGDGICFMLHVSCVSRFIHTSLEIMEQP